MPRSLPVRTITDSYNFHSHGTDAVSGFAIVKPWTGLFVDGPGGSWTFGTNASLPDVVGNNCLDSAYRWLQVFVQDTDLKTVIKKSALAFGMRSP